MTAGSYVVSCLPKFEGRTFRAFTIMRGEKMPKSIRLRDGFIDNPDAIYKATGISPDIQTVYGIDGQAVNKRTLAKRLTSALETLKTDENFQFRGQPEPSQIANILCARIGLEDDVLNINLAHILFDDNSRSWVMDRIGLDCVTRNDASVALAVSYLKQTTGGDPTLFGKKLFLLIQRNTRDSNHQISQKPFIRAVTAGVIDIADQGVLSQVISSMANMEVTGRFEDELTHLCIIWGKMFRPD